MSNNEANKENIDPVNRLDDKEWPPLKVSTIVVAEEEGDSSDSSDSESDSSEGSGEEADKGKEAEEKKEEEVQEKAGDDGVMLEKPEAEVKEGGQPTEPTVTETKAQSAQEALDEKLGALPDTLFGVPIRQHGSASVGIQMVTFAELRDLKAEMSSMVNDNNTAAGHVKAIHDMMQTITEAEKEGNKTWKKNAKAEMKEKLAAWKKEHNEKMAEHDREIRDLKRMLAEKEEAKKKDEEPVNKMLKKAEKEAKKAAKNSEKEAEKAARKALKRGSTSTMDGYPAKQVKAASPAPTPSSLTPEMRMKAAMAKAVEFKRKAEFSCVLCVLNDHKTAACRRYPVTTARRERLAELGNCLKCGKKHPPPCRFPARDCMFCHGPHVNFLCKETFDD